MSEKVVAPNGREFETDRNGRISGAVRVGIDEVTGLGAEAFRSRLGIELTGSDRVRGVDWRIEEAEGPDSVRVVVRADASAVVEPAPGAPTP